MKLLSPLLLFTGCVAALTVPPTITDPKWTITDMDLTFAGPKSKVDTVLSFTVDRGSGTPLVQCKTSWKYNFMLLTRNDWDWVWCGEGKFSFAFPFRSFYAGWHITNRRFGETGEYYEPQPWNMTIQLDQYRFYHNLSRPDNSFTVYHNSARPAIAILPPGASSSTQSITCTGGNPTYNCKLTKALPVASITKENSSFQPFYLTGLKTFTPARIVNETCFSPLSIDIRLGPASGSSPSTTASCKLTDCPSSWWDTCFSWSTQWYCEFPERQADMTFTIQPHDSAWKPACHGGPPEGGFDLMLRGANRENHTLGTGDWVGFEKAVINTLSVFEISKDKGQVSCDEAGCTRTIEGEVPFKQVPKFEVWGALEVPPTP